MSSFNPLERAAARLLSRFPFVKKLAKSAYSRLVFVKAKKGYIEKTVSPVTLYTHDQNSSFFGYYDKTPMNEHGFVLTVLTEQSTKQKPTADKAISLAVLKDNKLVFQVPVHTYNWQQGCRAHWLNNDEFIVNDFDKQSQKYISRVFSLGSKEQVRQFSLPVQDSYKDDFFIAINYKRLMALRPDYGYRNLPSATSAELADLQHDGLWYVDMPSGHASLLVSIKEACELNPVSDFDGAQHKFNHVIISPNGKQLIFMHRFLHGQRRFDRLLLLDIASKKLRLLADYGMVSHCFWADDNTILGYMRGPENVDAYWLINLETQGFSRLPNHALQELGDGHPHVYGDWFVTDTYPDKARMQHLVLCNWKTGEVKRLGEFFHGFEFDGESRCDLHPRFSMDGSKVFFDSVFTGKRQLYSMDVVV